MLGRRVAVVTGVSRRAGLGAAIARELSAAGARLFLTFYRAYDARQPWARSATEPEDLLRELRAAGGVVDAVERDLADPDAAGAVIGEAVARGGAVDILVNNAAHSEDGNIAVIDAAQLDRHYAVNLRATTLLCAEFVRAHQPGRPGRIINITSGQGHSPMPGELAYAITKGGIDVLTTSLAAALAGRGITVNAVDPGPTDTGWMSDALKAQLEAAAPMGRVGVPLDAAQLVRFLASDEAGWITGQIIRSRGGL